MKTKNFWRQILLFSLLVLSISGCIPFIVKVDSISDVRIKTGKRYILLPGMKGIPEGDLQFREFAEYVRRGLHKKGYTPEKNTEEIDIAIFLSYGIGDPKIIYYSSSEWVFDPSVNGSVKSQPQLRPTKEYHRYLVLKAIDLREYKRNGKFVPIWKTTVTSYGSSGDLRRVFPVLVAAALPYIGTNTGKKVNVLLTEINDNVKFIKGTKATKP